MGKSKTPRTDYLEEVAKATTTQVRHPWRATVRTVLWATVAFAGMWALVVEAMGLDQDVAWVTTSLVVTGAINRIMALPAVEAFLKEYAPWLAADPSKGFDVSLEEPRSG